MNVARYLIVDSVGKTRTAINRPPARIGEWVFLLRISLPDLPDVVQTLELEIPAPAPAALGDAEQVEGVPVPSRVASPAGGTAEGEADGPREPGEGPGTSASTGTEEPDGERSRASPALDEPQ